MYSAVLKNKIKNHLIKREGVVYQVYKDSLGYLTAGVGHLLTPEEKTRLKLGDKVSKQQVEQWLEKDMFTAMEAAHKQAAMTNQINDDWILALTSVNFQLGTGWTKKFFTTWPALVNGNYDKAISNIKRSKWMSQTPVRANDFIAAIEQLKKPVLQPKEKIMTKEAILGFVRHILTFGGGYATSAGLATTDEVTAGVGAFVTLVGVIWSVLQKRKAV